VTYFLYSILYLYTWFTKNYLQLYGQKNLYMSLNKRFKRTAKLIARCKYANVCKHLTCWLKDYKTEVTSSSVTLRIILHTLSIAVVDIVPLQGEK
jgi:hypothetical protein